MVGIESFLVLAVAMFYLAVVPRSIGTDQLVADPRLCGSLFKQCRQISLAVGKEVSKPKTIVCLDTFHLDAAAAISSGQLSQEIH